MLEVEKPFTSEHTSVSTQYSQAWIPSDLRLSTHTTRALLGNLKVRPDVIDSGYLQRIQDPHPTATTSDRPGRAGSRSTMPHLIFQIDEILRPIATYVGQASRPTAIDFARCCRAFEEPALQPLWESTTLGNLMHLFPEDVLYFGGPGICVVCALSHCLSDRPSTECWHVSEDIPPAHSS